MTTATTTASVRDTLLEVLLARLKLLPGYVAERRMPGENDADHAKLALLIGGDENVAETGTNLTRARTMAVKVFVQVRGEDAPKDLGSNPERYLDHELARVEKALYTPLALPNNDAMETLGWVILAEPDSTLFRGVIELSITYHVNAGNPTVYAPGADA